jgi:NADH-quinone oxidoreductase subunit I
MSILSDIWDGVRTTLAGLRVTVPYIWRKPVTTMYPHQRLELPERTRNRLYVNMDDCIGCDQCARACPVDCIDIETVKAVEGDSPGITSDGRKKALWVTKFDIDIAKCCYCGLCTYPCPTECIKMTDVFEFAEGERNNLIYSYITMTPDEIGEKIAAAEADAAAQAARKAAAKAAAAKTPTEPASAGPSTSSAAQASPSPAAPAGPPPADDPGKAARIAELQAKMAAARARREADAATEQGSADAPAPPPVPDEDVEKAARIAAMKEKIEALKRQRGEG